MPFEAGRLLYTYEGEQLIGGCAEPVIPLLFNPSQFPDNGSERFAKHNAIRSEVRKERLLDRNHR